MSWSISFKKPVLLVEAETHLERLSLPQLTEGPAIDQFNAAKRAAKILLHNISGPYVNVSLSGHANGVGWQKKEGWANDCINISISQMTEADLPKQVTP